MPIMTTGISSSLPPTLQSRVQWFTVDFYLKAVVGYLSGFPKSHLRKKARTQRASNFSYLFAGKNAILGQVLPSSQGRQSREERNVCIPFRPQQLVFLPVFLCTVSQCLHCTLTRLAGVCCQRCELFFQTQHTLRLVKEG